MLLVMIGRGEDVQMMLGMISIVLYLVVLCFVRPYVSFGDDVLWVACLLQLFVTIYCGTWSYLMYITA